MNTTHTKPDGQTVRKPRAADLTKPEPVLARLVAVTAATRAAVDELLAGTPTDNPKRRLIATAAKKVNAAATRAEAATDNELAAAVDDLVIRTTELLACGEDHPDGLSRYLSVARRVACVVLGDEEGERVGLWCENLERGEYASATG